MADFATAAHVFHTQMGAKVVQQAYSLLEDKIFANWDLTTYGPEPLVHAVSDWFELRDQFRSALPRVLPEDFSENWSGYLDARNFHRLKAAQAVVAWLGQCTQDQMLAAWLVHFMSAENIDTSKLHIVSFSPWKYHPLFSPGELSPKEVSEKALTPVQVTKDLLKELEWVWHNYAAGKCHELASHAAGEVGVLRNAIASLMARLPDIRTGLGSWDRLLLENVRDHGPSFSRVIGYTIAPEVPEMHCDTMGDIYLAIRLLRMASPHVPRPLAEVQGDRTNFRKLKVSLTADGEAVLSGSKNAIRLNGIDDWVGGKHLTPSTLIVRDGLKLMEF